MKDFFKSKIGKAIASGISVAVVWAICTPIFDSLFRGGITWDTYRYVFEPIVIGVFLAIIEYFLPVSRNKKDKK